MNQIGKTLSQLLVQIKPQLEALSEPTVSQKPAPNKWSPKEILGHLIDSAANNHQRFVRAPMQKNLIFVGYDQDQWVLLQDYQNKEWSDIIELWHHYNKHLAQYIQSIPVEAMETQTHEHNLHNIAYVTVPKDQSTNLSYFIHDYVGHLEHHIRQILPGYVPIVLGTYC